MIKMFKSVFNFYKQDLHNKEECLCLFDPTEYLYTEKETFTVPLEICVSYLGFGYHSNAWHPFLFAVNELSNISNLHYKDSMLKKYYSLFIPKTMAEAYFPEYIDEKKKDIGFLFALSSLDAKKYNHFYPWRNPEYMLNTKGELQHYGPATYRGEDEFNKLRKLYYSIKNYGFIVSNTSPITGYFLKDGENYRFLIRSGIHRASVLAALGYNSVPVRFKTNKPRVIDLYDARNWPTVKIGLLTLNVAQTLFSRYFDDKISQYFINIFNAQSS